MPTAKLRIAGPLLLALTFLLVAGCRSKAPQPQPSPTPTPAKIAVTVTSPAFADGAAIPAKYTCDGENISPTLAWGPAPNGAVTWTLIVEDPDAPGGLWTHWVVFNLPVDVHALPEHQSGLFTSPNGGTQGLNDFKKPGYGGPCPPSGTHRYVFRVYAVDSALSLKAVAGRAELLAALKGHILAEGSLTGTYTRK